jgi:hypothetical protein
MTESGSADDGLLVPSTKGETVLDVAAVITSIVPWIGGPVSAVLGGMSLGRKMDRVKHFLDTLSGDLKDFKSVASEQYVKTDDFQELLEKTLRRISDERSEEKREIYRLFLSDVIKSPGGSYDEQLRYLRTMEELQPDHLRIIKAILEPPAGGNGYTGSQSATLTKRMPGITRERIAELVDQLNDMRLINMTGLNTMMTYDGAQDLRHCVTPYGQRFAKYLLSELH